jgi:hypothetical protein
MLPVSLDCQFFVANFKYIYVLMLTTRTFSNLSPKCKINVCTKFKVDRRRNQTGGRRGRVISGYSCGV